MANREDGRLIRRSTDALLMPPPPPTKRMKRPAKVLDEDVYASALSHIIARDFFPGLLEGEAQDEYLSAVQSNDPTWIREAGRKMTDAMTPGPNGRSRASFTPRRSMAGYETPVTGGGTSVRSTPRVVNPDFAEEKMPNVDIDMSLTSFQAKYASEDNESFNELLDKQNTRRAKRNMHYYHGNKIPTARQIAFREALPASSDNNTSIIVRNSLGETRQVLAPERPSQDFNTRPAQLESFPNRQGPRNTFMFEPDSVEDHLETAVAAAETRSRAPPKATNYPATRFATAQSHDNRSIPPSPSMSAVDDAIAGRPRLSESSIGYTGAETPRVNGYSFVDAEPTEAELGMAMTDQEAEAIEKSTFDKLLPTLDRDGPNPFKLRQKSKREDIHEKLVEKADVSRRKNGSRLDDLRRLGITPARNSTTPRSSTPVKGQMTPAAQNLAARLATPRRGW